MTSLFLPEGFLIASSAELFGLYKFCSEDVVDGNGELLGSLEMYCSVPRSPFSQRRPVD